MMTTIELVFIVTGLVLYDAGKEWIVLVALGLVIHLVRLVVREVRKI